ncbi:MAG: DUF1738 domain-containing protein [Bacteroidetes bacterium]|nr:DUF1738 domain-containing protein [Bacteroidota bacterium]
MKTTIYQSITERIISFLTQENLDFKKPWMNSEEVPYNPVTRNFYSGLNMLMLSLEYEQRHYKVNNWLTFKQINAQNATLKKGAKGCDIFFTSFLYVHKETKNKIQEAAYKVLTENEQKNYFKESFLKRYFVFNVCDCEGLQESFLLPKKCTFTPFEVGQFVKLFTNLHPDLKIIFQDQDRAYFNPTLDLIKLPETYQFEKELSFYPVFFHELAHWTGHSSRLNRTQINDKKSAQYAFEELIAELSAVFSCARMGINVPLENSAAYIKTWLTALKEDNQFIFKAYRKATQATNFIFTSQKTKVPAHAD